MGASEARPIIQRVIVAARRVTKLANCEGSSNGMRIFGSTCWLTSVVYCFVSYNLKKNNMEPPQKRGVEWFWKIMFLTKPTKRNCLEREVPHLWTMCPCIVPPTRICTGYPSRDLRCFTRNHPGQKNWSHQMMCLDLPYGWCVVSVSNMFLDTWKIKTQLVHFHVAPQFCEPCAALARPCFFLPILVPQQAVWDILSFTAP